MELDPRNGDNSFKGASITEQESVVKKSIFDLKALLNEAKTSCKSALADANSRTLRMINLNRIMFDKNLLLNWLATWQNATFYSFGKRDGA